MPGQTRNSIGRFAASCITEERVNGFPGTNPTADSKVSFFIEDTI